MTTGEVALDFHSPYQFTNYQNLRENVSSILFATKNRLNWPGSHHHSAPACYSFPPHHPTRVRMTARNTDEMETLQRLSDQYHPEIEGPLVGEKKPMSVLMAEYAQADPIYVAKTAALAATHSAYRAIKGDGQCGWRAAVFGYFETLFQIGDLQMVVHEETRLRSFEQAMRMAGIDPDFLIDMFDLTWELFLKLRQVLESQEQDSRFLLDIFNDPSASNSILYHFKMMTTAYMQVNADSYQAFLEMPLDIYRATRLEPTNQEIDQIGLQALTDAVIGPAYIGLEVSYLDRSSGNTVTPHQFVQNSAGYPTIRLLYRPGHYDMIYKSEQTPHRVMMQRQGAPLNIVSGTNPPVSDLEMASYLFPQASVNATLTPQGRPAQDSNTEFGQQMYLDPFDPTYPQLYASAFSPQPPTAIALEHPPQISQQWPDPPITYAVTPSVAAVSPSTIQESPVYPQSSPTHAQGEVLYRKSMKQYELDRCGHESVPLMTGPFKSSPHNQAHFLNTDFQPLLWNAEEEYGKP